MPMTRVRALERAQAELDGRRAELRASIATALEDRAEQVRDIEARLAQLLPQLAGARAELESTLLRAPASGVIVGLQANTRGGVIRAGEAVMDIVPEGQDLIVEAQVRPEDADDVQPGLLSEVRITAFSGRSMPMLEGEVQRISADRFTDERSGAGYFLARVSVPQPELRRLADDARTRAQVRPGLPAQVVIPTRKRTALQYFLEPLNQTLWGSFRESRECDAFQCAPLQSVHPDRDGLQVITDLKTKAHCAKISLDRFKIWQRQRDIDVLFDILSAGGVHEDVLHRPLSDIVHESGDAAFALDHDAIHAGERGQA